MKRTIEIKGAEGGTDAKLFAKDLASSYINMAQRLGWKSSVVCSSDNLIKIEISGKDLTGLLNEAGGHRVQRVPPTEKRGRVHTSSVVVAVLGEATADSKYDQVSDDDFRIEWFSGTGKGGQHRNKKQNSCRVVHIPTGITEARQGRKRESNLREAKTAILQRLRESAESEVNSALSQDRKTQMGSGMRGDKIRTYRFQDDQVVDHVTGKRAKCSKVMKGHFEVLWK